MAFDRRAIVSELCERIASGEGLKAICREARMPSYPTFYKWCKDESEFAKAYEVARSAAGKSRFISNADKWRFYYETVLPYAGDECLIWPFSRKGSRGYAAIWERKMVGAERIGTTVSYISRLLCEAVNGPPPSDTHEAAHTCGRGQFGCVSAKHLAWKTVQENNWDKDAHGTRIWGESHPDVVVTVEQVREMRERRKNGAKLSELMKDYGIAKSTAWSIVTRKTWKRVF